MKMRTVFKTILFAVLIEVFVFLIFFFLGQALPPGGKIDDSVITVITSDEMLVEKADKAVVSSDDFSFEMSIDFKDEHNAIWYINRDNVDFLRSNKIDKINIVLTDADGQELVSVQDTEVKNLRFIKEMYSIEITDSEATIEYFYRTEYMMYACMGIALVVYLIVVIRKQKYSKA